MPAKTPQPGELEPIETREPRRARGAAARSGCDGRSQHAYDNVPHYRQRVRRARGVHPERSARRSPISRRFPFTVKTDLRDNYPFGMFAVPREQVVAHPRVVGHDRQAHGRRLHAQRHRHLGDRDGALDPRGGRPRRRHRARRVRLRAVHRRPRRALRRGEARRTVIPMSGGQTEKQVQLIHDFKPDIIMVTPSYMLAIAEEMERQGIDPKTLLARDRHLRRRAVDADDARGDRGEARHRRDRHLRPVRGDRSRRRAGVHRDQGRAHRLGGPLLSGDRRSRDRRGAARRRAGRARVHVAHQGSAADHPLPHARPDAPAAADGARDAADREDHRPLRRHDDHPRRQRVPDADRGADPASSRRSRRTTSSRSRARSISTS